jgi:predicted transcriptional regulator
MLTKRTNILFKDDEWQKLSRLAKKKQTSAGQLVRNAVREVYFKNNKKERGIKEAFENIVKIRKVQKGTIDYKELINYGRKY